MSTKTLVLHTCCAPCSSLPMILFDEVKPFTDIGLSLETVPNIIYYFHNPNIYPFDEYAIRRDELIRYANEKNVSLVVDENDESNENIECLASDKKEILKGNIISSQKYEHISTKWHEYIKGLEDEPEKGLRCEKCFEYRLLATFEYAKKINADYVATVMSISPHKKTDTINKIGKSLESKFDGIEFLCFNFKKNNGFLRTTELSRENNLYRQKYCGCKYAMR